MAEQILHGSNVVTAAEQGRRERVAEGVRCGGLRDACLFYGTFEGALKGLVIHVLGRSGSKLGVVPASANPLAVYRSAPATILHHFWHRPVHGFGLGVRFATLGLPLASAAPRFQLYRASPVFRAVASSVFVVLFKAGSNGQLQLHRPLLPNNSSKPTLLSQRGLIQALDALST